MKLYSKPGACSTADHIALQWTGQPFEFELMTADGLKSPEFRAISPAGKVPVLVDGDFVLLQNAAILGYLADSFPEAGLAGDGSARQRAEATRWLSFVNSDVHPGFHPLFAPDRFAEDGIAKQVLASKARQALRGLFAIADAQLAGREWIAGFRSFADPYLYITLRWADRMKVDISGFDQLASFKQRMEADAGVRAALAAEGLD